MELRRHAYVRQGIQRVRSIFEIVGIPCYLLACSCYYLAMSIATSLFTDSQSRVFQWLFGQPERGYHLSELRRLTGLGSASLQRELNRLADAGLVRSERVGNLRRFQANPQSPVFSELVGLTRKTLGVEPLLREALLPLGPEPARGMGLWLRGETNRHGAERHRRDACRRESVAE
jgi:DNA-binding transcriptional ArsR family regulator